MSAYAWKTGTVGPLPRHLLSVWNHGPVSLAFSSLEGALRRCRVFPLIFLTHHTTSYTKRDNEEDVAFELLDGSDDR